MKGNPLLRNLAYNSDSAQNQNMFQSIARTLLCIRERKIEEVCEFGHKNLQTNFGWSRTFFGVEVWLRQVYNQTIHCVKYRNFT